MRIGEEPRARRPFAKLGLPGLRIGHEKALVAGQAADDGCLAVLGLIALIRAIRRLDAAEIADIFAERQLAVHLGAGDRLILVILRGECCGARLERFLGGRRPPILELAGRAELAALVVEAMAHFMADDRADRAIVHRRIGIRIEIGRLQDRGGEGDLVGERVVIGVHRLRRHAP